MMFTYKDLIDVAIGSPESGHVNFYALHMLLSNFARKLDCLDEVVEQDEFLVANVRIQSSLIGKSSKYRLEAGADPEEGDGPTEPGPEDTEAAPDQEAVPEGEAPVPVAEPELQSEAQADEAAPAQESGPPEPEPEIVAEVEVTETAIGTAGTEAPLVSHVSSRSSQKSRIEESMVGSLAKLEKRLSKVEMHKEQATLELQQFVNSLTGQMKLTMEQLNNVTHLLLDQKPSPHRIRLLRHIARQLRVLMRVGSDDEVSVSWSSHVDADAEEMQEEEEMIMEEGSAASEASKPEEVRTLQLDQHLCYTSERMLDEVVELKSDFCGLTNKVNELAAALLKQDSQRLMAMMHELQETVRDIRLGNSSNREASQGMLTKVTGALLQIGLLKKSVAHLDDVKIDKTEVELLLAEKVDFQQLAAKVSLEQLEEYKARLEKQFCETRHIISVNEKNVLQIIDNLRMTLGIDSLELSLKDFREMIERRVSLIAEALHKYMEMTNDECAAAAGRVKVLQDLSCLSCDTPCVMRTVERAKVSKLPNAKGSTGMAPMVTYELGSIRKSGIMGYYRKDEFPHAPNAWTKTMKMPMVKCVARHAGGYHTTHTADEHVQKVVQAKKNSGW